MADEPDATPPPNDVAPIYGDEIDQALIFGSLRNRKAPIHAINYTSVAETETFTTTR